MSKKILSTIVLSTILSTSLPLGPVWAKEAKDLNQSFKNDYAKLVSLNYNEAYKDAKFMEDKINIFLDKPSAENLEIAKQAWLKARKSYGQTEAFRFYEGPIDFVDTKTGKEGPEGRLNSWPLDEAYIDYTKGNPKSGIVNDQNIKLDKKYLIEANQKNDESQVSLGYHAIEFLLWGQDLSLEAPGKRPFTDYSKEEKNDRRREYLKLTTQILVEDLEFLTKEWDVSKWNFFSDNYAKKFVKSDDKKVKANILTALATLSGFELASERIATALDSSDQEDEHSCFSDNTHNDFIYNQQGIKNVYLGDYGQFNGIGIYDLVAKTNKKLADEILEQINKTLKLMENLPYPIDAKILALSTNGAKNSASRAKMEKVVKALQKQAKLMILAGQELGVSVEIMSE